MTTPFPFVAAQVLTAAQMNAITELVVNDKTASHTLTAADAGDRVIMNSASATTITVNTSVFTAGQVIYVTNKGAGVCTITAGTATVSTTGTLALAQFASGVLYCISAGVFLFEAYGVAASASGLTFLSSTTFTVATSVSLPLNTFTATHAAYAMFLNLTALTTDADFTLRFRAAGTDNTNADYDTMFTGTDNSGTIRTQSGAAENSIKLGENDAATGNQYSLTLQIINPQLAVPTQLMGSYVFIDKTAAFRANRTGAGDFRSTTQFDSLTFISSVASSITGTVRVYGYALS